LLLEAVAIVMELWIAWSGYVCSHDPPVPRERLRVALCSELV